MFDHIGFGVSDINQSRDFFLQALGPLGVGLAMEGPNSIGLGKNGKFSPDGHNVEAVCHR